MVRWKDVSKHATCGVDGFTLSTELNERSLTSDGACRIEISLQLVDRVIDLLAAAPLVHRESLREGGDHPMLRSSMNEQ
jgi:hypothetical protein